MKLTITALLCIISILSFGQVKLHNENEGLLYQCDSSYGYPNSYISGYWFKKNINEFDTIPALFAISECDSCQIKSMSGFFVRQKVAYNMIEKIDYAMEIIGRLNKKKQPLDSTIIFWYGKSK